MIIDGQTNGVAITTNGKARVFYNPVASLSEEIDGITFLNNSAPDTEAPDFGNGGAIYDLGNLTLNGDTFIQNTAAKGGGAVYNAEGSTLTVNTCTFRVNTATDGDGGAIQVSSNGEVPARTSPSATPSSTIIPP